MPAPFWKRTRLTDEQIMLVWIDMANHLSDYEIDKIENYPHDNDDNHRTVPSFKMSLRKADKARDELLCLPEYRVVTLPEEIQRYRREQLAKYEGSNPISESGSSIKSQPTTNNTKLLPIPAFEVETVEKQQHWQAIRKEALHFSEIFREESWGFSRILQLATFLKTVGKPGRHTGDSLGTRSTGIDWIVDDNNNTRLVYWFLDLDHRHTLEELDELTRLQFFEHIKNSEFSGINRGIELRGTIGGYILNEGIDLALKVRKDVVKSLRQIPNMSQSKEPFLMDEYMPYYYVETILTAAIQCAETDLRPKVYLKFMPISYDIDARDYSKRIVSDIECSIRLPSDSRKSYWLFVDNTLGACADSNELIVAYQKLHVSLVEKYRVRADTIKLANQCLTYQENDRKLAEDLDEFTNRIYLPGSCKKCSISKE